MANLKLFIDLISTVQILWLLILILISTVIYLVFLIKKERRLFSNIKRPVGIIGSEADKMEHEATLLKRVKFFNIDLLSAPDRSIDFITENYRLVILRYQKDSDAFWRTFEILSGKLMPIIVFAKPDEIEREDVKKIQRYSLHTLCNTPLRLISDVFSIMSTYPEGKP